MGLRGGSADRSFEILRKFLVIDRVTVRSPLSAAMERDIHVNERREWIFLFIYMKSKGLGVSYFCSFPLLFCVIYRILIQFFVGKWIYCL